MLLPPKWWKVKDFASSVFADKSSFYSPSHLQVPLFEALCLWNQMEFMNVRVHIRMSFYFFKIFVVVVQSVNRVCIFETPWTAARQTALSSIISSSLLKFMPTESVMPSNHILCCPLLLPPSIFPSIRVFSNESALHIRWPKYWHFTFTVSPSYLFMYYHWLCWVLVAVLRISLEAHRIFCCSALASL